MIPRALGPTSLAAGLFVVACGNSGSPTGTPAATTAAAQPEKPPAPVASGAVLERAPGADSAAPPASAPSPAAGSASASAPPSASAPSLPVAKPLPLRTAAPTASASAPRAGAVDAGAPRDGGSGDAGAPSPALLLAQQVDGIFAPAKTYSAHFKQQYTAKITGTVKESSGTVSVERPGKISFRYDPPVKNRIVSDGTVLKVYIADDNQMYESQVGKSQYPGALSFMMGNGIARSFDFTIVPARYAGTVLEGKPLTPNPSYQTINFLIDTAAANNGDLRAMAGLVILDAQGNRNRFEFERPSQPASFPPDEFTFTPPPGTNITR